MRTRYARRSAWLVGLSLLAACGGTGDDRTAPSTPPASTAVASEAARKPFVDARGVEVYVESTERIIPLDGDLTEIVFALGLGDRVVATDLSATYPPEADALPQIGYQRALSAEPILAFEPTVLLANENAGPPEALAELERVGVPLAVIPATFEPTSPAAKIRAVADLLGVPETGAALAARVQREIDAVTPEPALSGLRVAMLYVRGERVQLIFGPGTGIHWVIEATGAIDVADELGIVDTAEITAEALLAAAPDVLLVTDDGLESVGGLDGLVNLANVAGTPAARNRAVLAYDAQLMLGNGPRTGDFLERLAADLVNLRENM